MSEIRPQHIVAACTLVTRENGDVLMVTTHSRRGWEVPGGVVEIGESPIEGALRETLEESGITAHITQMAGIYTNITHGIVIFAFLGDYISGELTPSSETPEVAWVSRDKVLSLIEEPPMLARVGDMLSFNGQIIYRTYAKKPYQDVSVVELGIRC
ncbi:MAG: NUDIX hydrolase [Anaerolineae bacterium]|nr:NUDIX hydrolase [Anaerolineae bacterium]MDQ7037375.1 NUDIX hydrolase [Anaerolineae bacterium]